MGREGGRDWGGWNSELNLVMRGCILEGRVAMVGFEGGSVVVMAMWRYVFAPSFRRRR